jgi:hypothetical protein
MAPLETVEYKGHTISVYHDMDAENPTEWGNFTIVQFADWGTIAHEDRDTSDYFTEGGALTAETLEGLRTGKMFCITYRNHSSAGQRYYDLQEDYDNDSYSMDGFIIFEDDYIKDTTFEERKQYAKGDLQTYTDWANGDVYTFWVTHPEHEGGDSDTLSGIYGDEYGFQPVIDEAQSMIDAEEAAPYHHHYITAPRASRYHL